MDNPVAMPREKKKGLTAGTPREHHPVQTSPNETNRTNQNRIPKPSSGPGDPRLDNPVAMAS